MQKMRIHLNRKFYTREVIDQTLDAFKGACHGRVVSDDYEVELDIDSSQGLIADEFTNYVLALQVERNAGV